MILNRWRTTVTYEKRANYWKISSSNTVEVLLNNSLWLNWAVSHVRMDTTVKSSAAVNSLYLNTQQYEGHNGVEMHLDICMGAPC